jgi:hypothetical protein
MCRVCERHLGKLSDGPLPQRREFFLIAQSLVFTQVIALLDRIG